MQSGNRRTALALASMNNNLTVVHALIGAMADLNVQDKVMIRMVSCKLQNALRLLFFLLKIYIAVECLVQGGWSALMEAAAAGHTDVVQALLQAGADRTLKRKVY